MSKVYCCPCLKNHWNICLFASVEDEDELIYSWWNFLVKHSTFFLIFLFSFPFFFLPFFFPYNFFWGYNKGKKRKEKKRQYPWLFQLLSPLDLAVLSPRQEIVVNCCCCLVFPNQELSNSTYLSLYLALQRCFELVVFYVGQLTFSKFFFMKIPRHISQVID